MKYVSKKDPTVTAAFDFEDDKHHTTYLIYLTGPKKGMSFCVTNSTLKRYWDEVHDVPKVLDFTPEEVAQINTPYKPDVTPHYIPKPPAVIEYEEKKLKSRRNNELPTFEAIAEMFAFILAKVNERSNYVKFKDGTTLHRKATCIKLYTVENIWEDMTHKGFKSSPNNDKDRPFAFVINTKEEFETMSEVLINNLNTTNKEE
jgi:hypothetical protein